MSLQSTTASSPHASDGDDAGRLLLSGLFAAALVSVAVGYAVQLPAPRVIGLLGALCFGVGAAPLQLSRGPGLAARVGFAAVLGLSALTLVASLMVLIPLWHPVIAAVIVVGASVVIHAAAARGALRDGRRRRALGRRRPGGVVERLAADASVRSVAVTLIGTALWLGSTLSAGHVVAGNGGFLTKISAFWYVGLLLVVAGIVLARRAREPAMVCAVVSLVAALTLTPALIYAMPEVQTAGKHIEVVQVILRQHHLDVANGIYDAYSGFFSAIAWLCDLGQIRDSLVIATFWPLIIGLVKLAELRWLFGSLIKSPFRIWAAVTLAVLADTVEESYFSPQSLGFVLGLGVFALVLDQSSGAVDRRLRNALLVVAGCALALTHELSPFIVGGVLLVLALLRVGRPRWAAAAMLVPAIVWALLNRAVLSSFVSLSDLLNISNFAPPALVTAPGLHRLAISVDSFDALVAGLLVLIALAVIGWARHRHERWAWASIISPAVGLAFTAVNPYNNEGIFRAILFAIPWLALLAGAAVKERAGRWASAAFALATIGLLATFCVATFTLDGFTVIRSADLTALRHFEAQAPPGSGYIDLGFSEVPFAVATSRRPDQYVYWQSVLTGKRAFAAAPTAQDIVLLTDRFERYVRDRSGPGSFALYALWSPTTPIYAADYGLMSHANASAWRDLMLRSPLWTVAYSADGTYLFRLSARVGTAR